MRILTKIRRLLPALAVALSSCIACMQANGESVFPPALTVSDKGDARELIFTGRSKRVVLFFRVYEIAHYAELAGQPPLSLENVVSGDRSKALMIAFQRRLDRDQIREEFAKSLRRNAQPEWLNAAEPTIQAFMQAIDRGADDGDTLVFYWPGDGQLTVEFNGEVSFAANDIAFARLIWSIWFGDDPACDRGQLLARVSAEGNA